MPAVNYLKKKYSQIFYYSGLLIFFSSFAFFTPLISLIFYPEELSLFKYFLPSIGLCMVIGGSLYFKFRKKTNDLQLSTKEGGIVVVFSWVIIILLSAIPFITGMGLNFTQATFEAVSGWTTTGLSVVTESETPAMFLLWRSLMQFFGGAGITVIALSAILPVNNLSLYRAEARSDKLLPHVKKSTRLIVKLYSAFTGLGIIAYIIAGVQPFSAINHSMAALSTGGFSIYGESLAYYDSPVIEFITIVLMLAGTINFATHYTLFKGEVKKFFKNAEIKVMIWLSVIILPVYTFIIRPGETFNWLGEFRVSAFQVFSALSTTGFSTIDFNTWSPLGIFLIVILMLIGGGTGSTAGGIKQFRIYLAFKAVIWTIRDEFLPRRTVREDYLWRGENKVYIKPEHLKETFIYIFMYFVTFLIGSAFFMEAGYSIGDSMFEFSSSLGTVGLSIGITDPDLPGYLLWVQTIGMFLGRLEFLIIIFSISKIFKDLRIRVGGR
ncbi:MAG: TrkH family potassium uptake protein [Bacillota bacterium]